jgi:hypothetical protein
MPLSTPHTRPPLVHLNLDGKVETVASAKPPFGPSRSLSVRIAECTKTVSWPLDRESPPPVEAAFLAAALDSLCAMALKAASNPDSLDPVWTPWDYSAMLGAIPLEDRTWLERSGVAWPAKLDSVRLLAWYSTQGGSNALLWYRLIDARGEPAWVLEQAFQDGLRAWQPSSIDDAPWSPIRVFKRRPTNDDVYSLLAPPEFLAV